ncbi:TnsA endonuclease N-terminal domain-containing protein [Paenibacillus sp. FSL L8-0644]|uniref:TnsA endonuclease N-terminal domain-containing protein n=1 Tax=Paenibacillus sp. FSL L8-0644 TaxID=2954523 RepID=UPI0030F5880D
MAQAYPIPTTIEKWIKQGKGQGMGKHYVPWFTARQVPSQGRTHTAKGIKSGREHLLLSDLEWYYFYLLEWSDVIEGYREQYPLLPIEETIKIADDLGIDHPIDPRKRELKVMTTDFVIDQGEKPIEAVNIKPANKLTVREVEKMEIERQYWKARNVGWSLVTDKDIPVSYATNVQYVHKTYDLTPYRITNQYVLKARALMEQSILDKVCKLTDITNQVDDMLGLTPGNSLVIVRHLIMTKQWKVNMKTRIDPNRPLEILKINSNVSSQQGGIRRA